MKKHILLTVTCMALVSTLILPWGSRDARAQEPQPGDPVVTGNPDLAPTVCVFPYDVDIYGIYLVKGDQMTPVTSVAVEHVNVDRVTAKLSPDGFKVAYLVEFGGTGFSRLAVVGVDGLNSQVLFESDDPERYITAFEWSHDSNQVAYALSRDPFGAAPDLATPFENPDAEIDPDEATTSFDDPLELTGEVWITDLNGVTQEQIVDQGAMDVLGWTTDDTGILFTRYMTATTDTEVLAADVMTTTRTITPTASYAAAVSLVQVADTTVSDLLTNTVPSSSPDPGPIYTDFYLLGSSSASQKLAVVSAGLPFETLPFTDTALSLLDLGATSRLSALTALTLSTILTNSEAIANVSLSPDGTHLAYVTQQSGELWLADTDGINHTEIFTGGLSSTAGLAWGADGGMVAAMASQEPSLQVFDLSGAVLGSLSAWPSDALLAEPLDAYDVCNYNAPFVHQVWDTPDWFGGYCACGPTSATMALAFYNKLSPNPINISVPYPHTNSYGFYVPEKFGVFQTRGVHGCPAGSRLGYGIYGNSMDVGRFAWAWRIQDSLNKLGLGNTYDSAATFEEIKAALGRGHLVILSTYLTSAGHVVLVRGYTSDGKLIVNDPYGNRSAGSYGKQRIDGADARYTWNETSPRWFIEVNGTPPGGGGGCGGGVPTITHWKGEYFSNRDLSGQAALVRNDTGINFNWGTGSPNSGCIPSDNFSARWTRTLYFSRGAYRFHVGADDGVRLYVDGRRIIDAWYDQGFTAYSSSDTFLDGGNHAIKLEYYEHGGDAAVQLSWNRVGTGWTGEYYNNRYLSGSPTFTRNDDSIYFDWRYGDPGNGIGSDNFSVRWTKTLQVPRTGYYRFYARADDGIRLWVDGRLEIYAWWDQGATTYVSRWLYLTSGNHPVKVEYYENGGYAYAHLWLQPAFRTQFYNNRTLSGSPSWDGYYTGVWFDWGWGGPSSTGWDNFSARWTGDASLSGGRYKFCTRTDDGVRLYIDSVRVIDRWQDQGATTWCTDRDLSKGFHTLLMEYYEHGGLASAQLWWSKYSGSDALTATSVITEPTEADIWALYGDAGYLGPLVDADISAMEEASGHEVFLPVVLRQP